MSIFGLSACASRSTAERPDFSHPPSLSSTLVGRITDAETDAPLARVQVFLGGTAVATRTDSLGRYTLSDIPPGKYTVVAGHATRFTQTVALTARAVRVGTLNFRLRANPGPLR